MKKGLTIATVIGLAALLPLMGLAQISGVQTPPSGAGWGVDKIISILNTLIRWIFTLLLIVATFFILWAAYLYLTAAGDPEKVKQANNQLIYAAVAIAVALASQGIRYIVTELIQ